MRFEFDTDVDGRPCNVHIDGNPVERCSSLQFTFIRGELPTVVMTIHPDEVICLNGAGRESSK